MYTCPVLELDGEADFYLGWLLATHQSTEHGWHMTQLPGPGGVGEQDALLMEGIAIARQEANDYMHEQRSTHALEQHTAAYFDQVERDGRT